MAAPKRASFGELSLEIPGGWNDSSTIILSAPPPESPGGPTLNPMGQAIAPNIVLRREPHDGDESLLERIAAHQEHEVATVARGKVLTRGTETLSINGTSVTAVTREFSMTSPDLSTARQLQLYFLVDGYVYIFVGTATANTSFDALRTQFIDVANSIQT